MQEYEDNVPHLITRRVVHRKYFSPFFLIIIFCCVVILFACIFISKIINKQIVIKSEDYYLLSVNSSEDIKEANLMAQTVKEKGGAGYIYNDDKFYIIASVYNNINDAKKVLSKQKDGQIIKLDCPNKKIPLIEDKQTSKIFYTNLSSSNDIFNMIYSADNGYIKGEESINYLIDKIDSAISLASSSLTNLQNLYDKTDNSSILHVISFYENIIKILNSIDKNSQDLSVKTKYALIELSLAKKTLITQIK